MAVWTTAPPWLRGPGQKAVECRFSSHLQLPTLPPKQVEDLAVASPATVSRCGMVYMEPGALGLEPLFASWLARLPRCAAPHRELLGGMLRALVPPCLSCVSGRRAPACGTVAVYPA